MFKLSVVFLMLTFCTLINAEVTQDEKSHAAMTGGFIGGIFIHYNKCIEARFFNANTASTDLALEVFQNMAKYSSKSELFQYLKNGYDHVQVNTISSLNRLPVDAEGCKLAKNTFDKFYSDYKKSLDGMKNDLR